MARRRVVETDAVAEVEKPSAADRTMGLFEKEKMPAGIIAAEPGQSACERCGGRLTVTHLGEFYPCGHDPKIQGSFGKVWNRDGQPPISNDVPTAPPTPENATTGPLGAAIGNHVPDPNPTTSSVRVVWGKELFSPKQFHTYEVGPFEAITSVLPGETFEQAAKRAMEDLRRFAEQERERKKAAYLKHL